MKILDNQMTWLSWARLLPTVAPVVFLLAAHPVMAGDKDDDGVPNKYDLCPADPEDMDDFEDNDGCPDVDDDKDGVCDASVMEKGLSAKYASVCKGSDKCQRVAEDRDGFEDEDGCPDVDNDKDGIPDTKDKCPNEAEDFDGFEDNDGCPDVDNDKDGVCDVWVMEKGLGAKYASACQGTDKCPTAAEDKDGFEDEDGCPDLDNDKDGIPDTKDKCPNEAENINGVEDEDGCVDHTNPALEKVMTFPLVGFRSSIAELTLESQPPLDQFAKQLVEYSDKKIELRLFTWYKGKKKEEYVGLLKERSKAVVDYLVSKGVKPEQIQEVDYSVANLEAFKGTENDFNQEKPMEARLLE
jgi:outer membrane protein OmpA-like peptidoglycan-associated protein